MNKRSKVLLSIIVIVLAVFYILNRSSVSTLNNSESSFEFKQTDKIDKIFSVGVVVGLGVATAGPFLWSVPLGMTLGGLLWSALFLMAYMGKNPK